MKESSAGGPPPLATYDYDLNGNRITKTLENGTTASYIYDNASQLTRVKHMKSASTIAQFDYTLNAVGNRTAKNASGAIPNVNESYTYDAIDQVTGASKPGDAQTFAYDPTGNRTAVTSTGSSPGVGSYTTNALNQYSAAAGDVLLYDTKGNLTTQGLSASYSYGSKNRLLGATKGSNLYAYVGNNGVNATDPDGRMGVLGVFAAKGLLGAISGTIAAYTNELIKQISSGEDIDPCKLKKAAAAGAIGGAIGGLIGDPLVGGAMGGFVAGGIEGLGAR